MEGGSGAVNVPKFSAITDIVANVLQLKFNDIKAVMPVAVWAHFRLWPFPAFPASGQFRPFGS